MPETPAKTPPRPIPDFNDPAIMTPMPPARQLAAFEMPTAVDHNFEGSKSQIRGTTLLLPNLVRNEKIKMHPCRSAHSGRDEKNTNKNGAAMKQETLRINIRRRGSLP